MHNQLNMHNVHKLCKKEQKKRFSVIFLTLVARIDSVLHMMTVLNISQHLAGVIGHAQLDMYA